MFVKSLSKLGLLAAVIFFSGCFDQKRDEQDNTAGMKLELMSVDRAFSELSEKKGMKTAFIEYLDSNGVLLRPHNLPIIGANAIDYLVQQDDAGYTITWNPVHAEVSVSGDLGLTYGEYAIQLYSEDEKKKADTVLYGTYTSSWKKQHDNKWKLLLHTTNDGLGE